MDSDNADNGKFMNISKAVIVIGTGSDGKLQAIECSNNSDVFTIKNVQSYAKSNILFIGRILVYGSNTPVPKNYNITSTLTNCKIDNSTSTVVNGESYSAVITPDANYKMDLYNIKVTMDGVDITKSVCSIE